MVNILTPKSVYVDNTKSSTYTLTWKYTVPGQESFEVMYRQKGSSSWLTTGKIKSTKSTYDLRNIHTLTGIDFVEIQYKVKVYSSNLESETDSNGNTTDSKSTTSTEESNVYSLIFNQGIAGNLNVWTGSAKKSYPIFNTIKNSNLKKINFNTSGGIKSAPLVDQSSILASDFKVRVSSTKTECIASKTPKFTYYTPKSTDIFGYARGSVYRSYYYSYLPLKLVQAVYLSYSYTNSYSYYGGSCSYTANFYARYYTYATGVYLAKVTTTTSGGSTFGRGYGGADTAAAYLVYYAYSYKKSESSYNYTYYF